MNNKTLIGALVLVVVLISGAIILTKGSPQASPGTSVQNQSIYSLSSDSRGKQYVANTPLEYSFTVQDKQGTTLKDFAITHTKMMHLIVVRKDLAYFQHVHPEFDASTGTFTIKDLTFSANGEYRIFADFAAGGAQKDSMGMPMTTTLSEDVAVGGTYTQESIGSEEKTKAFDGMTVSLATHGAPMSGSENMLMFNLSGNGKPITDLEPYLGALGHAVILREGNLDFIHAHPVETVTSAQNGMVDFMVDFPEAGRYKVFTQFQRKGKVITTDFVITVAQGSPQQMQGMNMQGMGH